MARGKGRLTSQNFAFPGGELKSLMPDLWDHLSLVSDTLSVPLSWVLLAEVCSAAFLAPTSVLLPTKTMPIYPMPWAFILHPGATQTSSLVAAFQRLCDNGSLCLAGIPPRAGGANSLGLLHAGGPGQRVQ